MRGLCVVIILSTGLAGCVATLDHGNALSKLTFAQHTDKRVIVVADVNGQGPFRFAIDTAASISAVFTPLVDQLGIETDPTRSIMVQGLVKSGYYPVTRLNDIALGAAIWRDVVVVVLPGGSEAAKGLDGILGLDFLRQYVVALSERDGAVYLYDPAQIDDTHYRGWAVIDLRLYTVGHKGATLYATDINAGPAMIPAIVDLGAGLNMMNIAAAKLFGAKVTANPKYSSEVSGALGMGTTIYRMHLERVQTGPVIWRRESFIVADLPVFDAFVEPDQPIALLGADLLLSRDIVFDFRNDRLLIRKPPRRTSGPAPP